MVPLYARVFQQDSKSDPQEQVVYSSFASDITLCPNSERFSTESLWAHGFSLSLHGTQ
jgi:hypothetical protein